LAGVPVSVIDRARAILATLESDHLDAEGRSKIPARSTKRSHESQLSLFGPQHHPLLDEIRALDLDQMTPLAALEKLQKLRAELRQG
jgi:DNA mismatch repair protein MutS